MVRQRVPDPARRETREAQNPSAQGLQPGWEEALLACLAKAAKRAEVILPHPLHRDLARSERRGSGCYETVHRREPFGWGIEMAVSGLRRLALEVACPRAQQPMCRVAKSRSGETGLQDDAAAGNCPCLAAMQSAEPGASQVRQLAAACPQAGSDPIRAAARAEILGKPEAGQGEIPLKNHRQQAEVSLVRHLWG